MSSSADARRRLPKAAAAIGAAASSCAADPGDGSAKPIVALRWIPWIFAAKTTASGLLALLVAFTFNLDQPKWALLTVFIVAQPQSFVMQDYGFCIRHMAAKITEFVT